MDDITADRALKKMVLSFRNPGVKGKAEGMPRSGKVLTSESSGEKCLQAFPLLSPVRRLQQTCPAQRPQTQRPVIEAAG